MSTKKKLFLAVPVYGGMDPFFAQSLFKLMDNPPCEMCIRFNTGDSLVSRARNALTSDFLESDCTHLMFIDSDLVFAAEHVKRLMEHEEPVVGGMYPKKQQGPLAWVINGCVEPTRPRANGLQEVRYIGTGCVRVAREVFERMILRWGTEISFAPDHAPDQMHYDFWRVGTYQYPDGYRRYLSEDWYFCQRWLDLGGKVWADTRVVLKHVGTAVYPLKSQEPELFGTAPDGAGPGAAGYIAPAPAPLSKC